MRKLSIALSFIGLFALASLVKPSNLMSMNQAFACDPEIQCCGENCPPLVTMPDLVITKVSYTCYDWDGDGFAGGRIIFYLKNRGGSVALAGNSTTLSEWNFVFGSLGISGVLNVYTPVNIGPGQGWVWDSATYYINGLEGPAPDYYQLFADSSHDVTESNEDNNETPMLSCNQVYQSWPDGTYSITPGDPHDAW